MKTSLSCLIVALLFTPLLAVTQDTAPNTSAPGPSLQAVSPSASVPRLVRFSGVAKDANSKPLIGTLGITFLLYRDQEGGAPLWLETQNVSPGSSGNYTVQLGATLPEGLPTDIFASAEARWLGVQISGQAEQPRVLLLAVPYALKAVDAETIGGLPPSAFVRASSEGSSATGNSVALSSTAVVNSSGTGAVSGGALGVGRNVGPAALMNVQTNGGTAGYLPLFAGLNVIADAKVFQSANGSIGIGTKSPGSLLTVNGTTNWGQAEIVGPTNAEASMGFRPSNVSKSNTGDWLIGTNTGEVPNGSFVIQNAFSPDLTISSGGNVGIGTASPGSLLTVNGTTNWGQAEIVGPKNAETSMGFRPSNVSKGTTGDWLIGTNTGEVPNGSFVIQNAFTPDLTISSGGNVGIGTTNSQEAQLTVVGGTSGGGAGVGYGGVDVTGGTGGSGNDVGGYGVQVLGGNGYYGGEGVVATGGIGEGDEYASGGTGGVFAGGSATVPTSAGIGIWASPGGQTWAGYFQGDVNVNGTITATTKDFKIDHPSDPAREYLYHASIESSEMINLYTGNVTLDANGGATVQLPKWFQAENGDFRYSLTCVGGFSPVYVAEEISDNKFKIAGGKPGMKVSWQVTGVRQDAYAKAHPLQVEVEKPAREQGFYLHPELYGAPEQRSIEWARNPQLMRKIEERRAATARQAAAPSPH